MLTRCGGTCPGACRASFSHAQRKRCAWTATARIKIANEYCRYVTKKYPCLQWYRLRARGNA
jgi:hypothetical protein